MMYKSRLVALLVLLAIGSTHTLADTLGDSFSVNQLGSGFETPEIAVAPNGNFVTVWVETGQDFPEAIAPLDGSGAGVFSRIFDKSGLPVTNDFQVSQYVVGDQWSPDVAIDAVGNFVITWTSERFSGSTVTGRNIYARRYSADGVPLSDEFLVNTNTPYTNVRSVISMDSLGNFIVVWMGYDTNSGAFGVYGKRYDADGVAIDNEFLINTTIDLDQSYPSVSMNDNGAFVVVWHDGYFTTVDLDGADGSGWGIFGQLYDSTGAMVGGEFQINTSAQGNQRHAYVTLDNTGSFVVIWGDEKKIAPLVGLYGKVFNAIGDGVTDEFLIASDVMMIPLLGPSIESFSDGGVVAVYAKQENKVYGRRYSMDGIPLEDEFEISYPTGGGLSPSVATDSNQNFVVAWRGSLTGPYNINAQRFDGSPVIKKEVISSTAASNTSSGSIMVFDVLFIIFVLSLRFMRSNLSKRAA